MNPSVSTIGQPASFGVSDLLRDTGLILRDRGVGLFAAAFLATLIPNAIDLIRVLILEPTWESLEAYEGTELPLWAFALSNLLATVWCLSVALRRDEASWWDAVRDGTPAYGLAFGVGFISNIAIMLGLVCLIAPGLMAFAGLSLAPAMVVDQRMRTAGSTSGPLLARRKSMEAIQDSWALTAGSRWPIGLALSLPVLAFMVPPVSTDLVMFGGDLLTPEAWVFAYSLSTYMALVTNTFYLIVSSAMVVAAYRRLTVTTSVEELVEVFA